MEKGLMYLLVSFLGIWLILDDFFGGRKVSKLVVQFGLPDLPSLSDIGDALNPFGGSGHKQGDFEIKPGTPGKGDVTQPGVFDPNAPQGGT